MTEPESWAFQTVSLDLLLTNLEHVACLASQTLPPDPFLSLIQNLCMNDKNMICIKQTIKTLDSTNTLSRCMSCTQYQSSQIRT